MSETPSEARFKKSLESVETLWQPFKEMALTTPTPANTMQIVNLDEYFPIIVFDASEKMLAVMERLTAMYQPLAVN